MLLSEVFDQPGQVKRLGFGHYLGVLKDGTTLDIVFNDEIDGAQMENEYELSFSRTEDPADPAVTSMHKTQQGNEVEVFSTVLAAIQQFMKSEDPARIVLMSAENEEVGTSRSRLYRTMINRYFGAKYHCTEQTNGHFRFFDIKKKNYDKLVAMDRDDTYGGWDQEYSSNKEPAY